MINYLIMLSIINLPNSNWHKINKSEQDKYKLKRINGLINMYMGAIGSAHSVSSDPLRYASADGPSSMSASNRWMLLDAAGCPLSVWFVADCLRIIVLADWALICNCRTANYVPSAHRQRPPALSFHSIPFHSIPFRAIPFRAIHSLVPFMCARRIPDTWQPNMWGLIEFAR